jgi:hypothetical protein
MTEVNPLASRERADYERLQTLERSILEKARWLKEGGWFHAEEEGAAGAIHAAITGLHIDFENEATARQALEKVVAGLRGKLASPR